MYYFLLIQLLKLIKNQLVDSCTINRWDASNPELKFPRGCARSISTTFARKMESKTIQTKRPGTGKKKQIERTFSIRKFDLFGNFGLLHLSRNPIFPRKFPFGETKLIFPFTFHPKFPDFLETTYDPRIIFSRQYHRY